MQHLCIYQQWEPLLHLSLLCSSRPVLLSFHCRSPGVEPRCRVGEPPGPSACMGHGPLRSGHSLMSGPSLELCPFMGQQRLPPSCSMSPQVQVTSASSSRAPALVVAALLQWGIAGGSEWDWSPHLAQAGVCRGAAMGDQAALSSPPSALPALPLGATEHACSSRVEHGFPQPSREANRPSSQPRGLIFPLLDPRVEVPKMWLKPLTLQGGSLPV